MTCSQSRAEIAQKVAQHLHAKLSASEKTAVEERPTQDLVAYHFYVRALSIIYNAQVPQGPSGNLSEAVDLLNKAVARDPNFFQAYCQLAFVHDLVYQGVNQGDIDHPPARLALAQSAIDSAFRLKPDSGEAHLALGWHLYWGYSDYDRARAELALAQQSLPNNAQVYELSGSMDYSQRRWADAIHNLERACELDPRNLFYLINITATYAWLHDYDEWAKIMDRIVALNPGGRPGWIFRAHVELERRADTRPFRAAIQKILTNEPGSDKDPFVAGQRYTLACTIATGTPLAALRRCFPRRVRSRGSRNLVATFRVGVVAGLKGDETSARASFMKARAQQEEELRVHPDDAVLLADLGLIDAGLGKKRRGTERRPARNRTGIQRERRRD